MREFAAGPLPEHDIGFVVMAVGVAAVPLVVSGLARRAEIDGE